MIQLINKWMQGPWLFLIIILIGFSLKFYKLDYRYFWYDETWTILHTSGQPEQYFLNQFPTNEIRNISYYQDMLKLNEQDFTVASQLKGIYSMTNMTPLHYMLLVFWHRLVGDRDIHYRLFNVLIFALILPLLFLFTRRLFQSKQAGWIAVSLFAVSPFFQNYTIEARYNMLCTFLLLLNQFIFLHTIQSKKTGWWIAYIGTGVLTFYSNFNLGLLFIANFLYILIYEKALIRSFLISSFLILLVSSPWLYNLATHFKELYLYFRWMDPLGANKTILTLAIAQFYFAAYSFFTHKDFLSQLDMFSYHVYTGNIIQLAVTSAIIILFLYSLYYNFSETDRKPFVFVSLLLAVQFCYFFLSDLIRDSGISFIWRYNILFMVGFILMLARFYSEKLKMTYTLQGSLLLLLYVLNIYSIIHFSERYYYNLFEAQIANSALLTDCERPLMISDMKTLWAEGDAGGVLAFMNACKSDRIDVLRVKTDIQNIESYFNPAEYSDIYVLQSSNELIENLKKQLGNRMDSIATEGFRNEWRIRKE